MAEAMNAPYTSLLATRGLNAWYGESHILHGVDFEVHGGEVLAEGDYATVSKDAQVMSAYLGTEHA